MEEVCDSPKVKCKTLIIQGDKYRTLLTKKFENRKKWVNKNENLVFSVIPGTVIKVFVKAGMKVNKGDKALILEAMKMENTISYPKSGNIKEVYVKSGGKIAKNYLMFEFE